MLLRIRPAKTFCILFILSIYSSQHAAQSPAELKKANATPPPVKFSTDISSISKSVLRQLTNKKKIAPVTFQAFQYNLPARTQNNIACPDSSFLKIFVAQNRACNFFASAKTTDGGIVIAGYGRDITIGPPYTWYGVITKFDSIGQHIWSRELKSDVTPGLGLYIENIAVLSDGSIIVSGVHENPLSTSPPTAGHDFFMAKLNSTGSLIWLKTFHSLLGNGCTTSNIRYAWVTEGANGDLYVGATVPNCPSPIYLVVFKLNNAGDLLWQYNFTGHFLPSYCVNVFYEGTTITVVNLGEGTDLYSTSVDFVKLNAATGAYVSHKSWQPDLTYPANFQASYLNWSPTVVKLVNGNYCVYGNTFGDFNNPFATNIPHFSVLEFNSSYDFVKGYTINSPLQNNAYGSKIKVDRFGKVIYGMTVLQNYPDVIKYYGIADNGVILHQRKKAISGLETFYDNAELFDDGSVVYISNLATAGQSNFYLHYSLMHISDTSSECLGIIDNFSGTAPINYKPNNFTWTTPNANPVIATNNQNNSVASLVYTAPPPCYQLTVCDTLKIHGIANSCNIQQDFIFTAFKNAYCGARVNWFMDTTVLQAFQVVNDTTLLIRFDQSWQGWLYAKLQTSCGVLTDSILLTITASPGVVNIGPDTTICTGNPISLNAHSGYATYLWSNGTTDSITTINSPGTYFIDVTDACGNSFSDTVLVSPSSKIPISIGPDRIRCNSDTLHLQAPGGFLSYTWSPDYNISATNTQQVVVNPAVDTSYIVIAEKTPGCFAYDTLRVTVNTSPLINLGPDKSFCTGDSLVLNAGNGFTQYQWSNGSNTQQVAVFNTGTYSVVATTAEGCNSFDTVQVVNLYSLPVVSLNKDSTLCTGEQRILTAGNGFVSYNWNTGSSSSSIIVNDIGIYSVTVIDNNGCRGSDTAKIKVMFPKPAGFLAHDTSICSYDDLQLKTITGFAQYIWSTGSSSPSILIDKPGIYWLQVKDNNGCTGKDSIIIAPKDCGKGFFMPTAFTPNNDGKNDIIKPILLGNILHYKFRIYNRWGELIFETTDLTKGWNGIYKGQPQKTDVFVWRCVYQFMNESANEENGTFILIR